MSFELGIPEEELAARLTNRSFVRYQHYAQRWMLPSRRLQVQLALVAMWCAKAAGAQNVDLTDFVFDPIEQDDDEEADAANVFEFKPRPKRSE